MASPADHPARYTPALLNVIGVRLAGCRRIIDPFGGTGERLAIIAGICGAEATGVEISPSFIEHRCVIAGDATRLPFPAGTFDGGCSSPTYGNGMNDHFVSREDSVRHTYRHAVAARVGDREAQLPATSTARFLFDSPEYRALHVAAWSELHRVLTPGAVFVLNTKNVAADRRRGGKVACSPVTAWHRGLLTSLGFVERERVEVAARGLPHGADGTRLRVGHEDLTIFTR